MALARFERKFTRSAGPQQMIIALPMKSADKRESKGDKQAHYQSAKPQRHAWGFFQS